MGDLFRSWQATPTSKDPELQRLEKEVEEARKKIHVLKEEGRQRRARRLESLDALETRRMTLQEIFKRMEKELAEKDVDDYADVLAEAFGERVIFAHRAIGLEALLCQFMHQMLAKQHQLKILKKSGKDLQKIYQGHKNQNREEFHSYEALAVHLETMRLSLEAQYDDIFAIQHSLLARLHHVEAGGTMTNYKIVKPEGGSKQKKKPELVVSNKHAGNSPKGKYTTSGDSDDDEKAMMEDILSGKDMQEVNLDGDSNYEAAPPSEMFLKQTSIPSRTSEQKSARDRRREIEQKRLAAGRGSSRNTGYDDPDKDKARGKMRELEASRGNGDTAASNSLNHSQLKEKYGQKGTSSPSKSKSSSNSVAVNEDDPARARREKRKNERAAARAAAVR